MKTTITVLLLVLVACALLWGARATNGSNQCLYSSSNVNLSSTKAVTIAAWIWWNAYDNGNAMAVEVSSNSNSYTYGIDLIPNSGSPCAGYAQIGNHGTAGWNSMCFSRPSAQTWHHWVVTIDRTQTGSSQNKAYIDGAAVTMTASANTYSNTDNFSSAPVYIGARGCSTLWSNARFKDVAIWNRVLSANEILQVYRGGAASLAGASLKWYLPLEGTGSPEADLSGNVANAAVTGATLVANPPVGQPVWGGR